MVHGKRMGRGIYRENNVKDKNQLIYHLAHVLQVRLERSCTI
jgi:hypothetical protein